MVNYSYIFILLVVVCTKGCCSKGDSTDSAGKEFSEACINSTTLTASRNCKYEQICQWNESRCAVNGNCIPMSQICDGVSDCSDNSDELDCQDRTCNPYQFKCTSGKCIPKHLRCNGEIECLDGSDESYDKDVSLALPKVTIFLGSELIEGNSTYQSMKYEDDIQVKFVCEADYPIEWVFNFENVAGSAEFEEGNVLETTVPIEVWDNSISPRYKNQLNISYYTIFGEDVFYCRAVEHPCTQRMVVSLHDVKEGETGIVEFRISDSPEKKITSIFSPTYGDTQSKCEAIWYYEKIKENGGGVWRCAHPSGKPGKIAIINCGNANACNNYFRNNRQPKHCVQPYIEGETCNDCHQMSDNRRKGRIIECYHEDETLRSYTLQVFNSLEITDDFLQKIYYELADAPMDELLWINEFLNDIYIGEDIVILCRVSAYYFQPVTQIALEYSNGTIEMLYPTPDDLEFKSHEYEHATTYTVRATTETLTHVTCIGAKLDTLEYINISRSVNIQVPIQPMLMVLLKEDDEAVSLDYWKNETIQWDFGDTNKNLHCNVSGKPVPEITWTKDGNETLPTFESRSESESWTFSQIHFSTINETVAGVYQCTAANIANNHTKHFQVIVKGSTATAGIVGGAVATGIILAMLLIACVKFLRRNKKKTKNSGHRQQTAL